MWKENKHGDCKHWWHEMCYVWTWVVRDHDKENIKVGCMFEDIDLNINLKWKSSMHANDCLDVVIDWKAWIRMLRKYALVA